MLLAQWLTQVDRYRCVLWGCYGCTTYFGQMRPQTEAYYTTWQMVMMHIELVLDSICDTTHTHWWLFNICFYPFYAEIIPVMHMKYILACKSLSQIQLFYHWRDTFQSALTADRMWNQNSKWVSTCFLTQLFDLCLYPSQASPGLISWETSGGLTGWETFTLSFHTICCLRSWQRSVLCENSPQRYGKSFWRP